MCTSKYLLIVNGKHNACNLTSCPFTRNDDRIYSKLTCKMAMHGKVRKLYRQWVLPMDHSWFSCDHCSGRLEAMRQFHDQACKRRNHVDVWAFGVMVWAGMHSCCGIFVPSWRHFVSKCHFCHKLPAICILLGTFLGLVRILEVAHGPKSDYHLPLLSLCHFTFISSHPTSSLVQILTTTTLYHQVAIALHYSPSLVTTECWF